MRHPNTPPLPHSIDPWAFARQRTRLEGKLPIHATQEIKAWKSEEDFIKVKNLEGYLDQEKRAHLKGELETTLALTCQRCLEPLLWRAEIHFDYLLSHSEAEDRQMNEEGLETLPCLDEHLDLAWFLEEEILLAMPMIARHKDCELPQKQQTFAPEPKESPFAQLKDLLNKKET